MLPICKEIRSFANPKKARLLQGYFKTGKGEYGEGDIFLGLAVGDIRAVAKKHSSLSLKELEKILESKFHEERLAAVLILVQKFGKADEAGRKEIFDFYLSHTAGVNNWDLVDLSAHKIVGEYLVGKPKALLSRLAKSKSLWERRIAVIATFAFIDRDDLKESFKLAEILLNDKHDLIHKAVGWVLREAGKKDLAAEEAFLKKHYKEMPRTMLRYAIERFEEKKRKAYLHGKI